MIWADRFENILNGPRSIIMHYGVQVYMHSRSINRIHSCSNHNIVNGNVSTHTVSIVRPTQLCNICPIIYTKRYNRTVVSKRNDHDYLLSFASFYTNFWIFYKIVCMTRYKQFHVKTFWCVVRKSRLKGAIRIETGISYK